MKYLFLAISAFALTACQTQTAEEWKAQRSFRIGAKRACRDVKGKELYPQGGIVLYELDDEPLAEPKLLTAEERLNVAREHCRERFEAGTEFFVLSCHARNSGFTKRAAFLLHQAIEQAYSCVLLTLTNYGPASHNIKFLRSLAEEQDLRLVDAFPRDHHRQRAWFNTINEAYVKARYSKHFEISEEALVWLGECTAHLLELVKVVCDEHIQELERDVSRGMA